MRLILATLLSLSIAGAVSAKSRDPIQITEGVSPAQQVVSMLVVRALKKSGFKYELVDAAKHSALDALANGKLHAHPAAIVGDHPELRERVSAKEVRSLGGLHGNGQDEDILKLVWPGMKKKWPYAQKMLKRLVLRPEQIADLVGAVKDGASPEEAAADWWKANPKVWKPWIAASKNWMKP